MRCSQRTAGKQGKAHLGRDHPGHRPHRAGNGRHDLVSAAEREGQDGGEVRVREDPMQEPLPDQRQVPRNEVHDAAVEILPETDH